jgi:HTH-type transcriptional regulator/antitoxin HigA
MPQQHVKNPHADRRSYLALVRKFPLRPIRSEKQLDHAIAVMDSLLDMPRRGRAAEDYLDVLGDLVKRYEDQAHPIEDVCEADTLEHLLEARA